MGATGMLQLKESTDEEQSSKHPKTGSKAIRIKNVPHVLGIRLKLRNKQTGKKRSKKKKMKREEDVLMEYEL